MISGLILAAGQSKRLGGVKPLLIHETSTLIEIVINHYRTANLDDIILVLGHEARRVIRKLPLAGLKVVINPTPSLGMASSLQRGMAHMASRCDAVMIAFGDMPLVTTATINGMIAAFQKSKKGILVPVYKKERGHPVIFDVARHLDALLRLRGDVGAREIIAANPKDVQEFKVNSDEILVDVDTHEDWEQIRERLESLSPATSFA